MPVKFSQVLDLSTTSTFEMLFLTDVGELCQVHLTRPDLGRFGGSPVVEVLEYGLVLAKLPRACPDL